MLIDADMIVTRSLGELIERAARAGRRLRNRLDRFVPEWGEMLGLGSCAAQPYVCSASLLALDSGNRPSRLVGSTAASPSTRARLCSTTNLLRRVEACDEPLLARPGRAQCDPRAATMH